MRSAMEKPFDTFKITLKQNGLEDFFRNSYFGHFLDLPENNTASFQMTMVYELLKRRLIFQNPEKNDEVLINYCGMPLFFGRREFAIVSGLKCHPPSEPVPEFIVKKEPRRRKKGGKKETRQSTEEHDLMSLVGTSFKNSDLIYLLNVEDIPRKHRESLCLLWFVHNVLLAKDLNNNISLKWVNLSQDIEAFSNYPWGHESFELTVRYLLKPLGPNTNNLFGFPWDFMSWAFEVIPHLTHQVNVEEEISSPRILRWLRSKTKIAKNIPDLYNPPHDAVVHPWLVPIEKELQMQYLITLGLIETLFDLIMDRVKMELAGARTIKRDRVVNELVVFYRGNGRGIDVGVGAIAGAGAGQNQRATSCRRCSGFLCEKCKKQDEDFIMYLQTLNQAVNEFKNKTGVKVIPSKNVRHPYTPQAKRRKKSFIKAIQNLKNKIFGELPMVVGEEVLEFKHVNVYKRVTIVEKNKLVDLATAKDLRANTACIVFVEKISGSRQAWTFGGKTE
uniref:Mutator-like transposase n=1 Tax=Solanum tuberosum TaxID=4113 RepID=M1BGQ4_SOLTU